MQNKHTILILLAFLATGTVSAQAGQVQIASNYVREQSSADPATMDDAALASYITGRLKQALKDDDDKVDQYCDAFGCTVVVQ